MRCNTVESDFVYLSNISPFEEEIIYSSSIEMMEKEI
jgi:hypothetical protein